MKERTRRLYSEGNFNDLLAYATLLQKQPDRFLLYVYLQFSKGGFHVIQMKFFFAC